MESVPTWPKNVAPFTISGWPVGALSPDTMRLLKKIADQDGWTIEEVMATAMEEFEIGRKAEKELKTKISDFRNAKFAFADSRFRKKYGGVDLISDRLQFAWFAHENAGAATTKHS